MFIALFYMYGSEATKQPEGGHSILHVFICIEDSYFCPQENVAVRAVM